MLEQIIMIFFPEKATQKGRTRRRQGFRLRYNFGAIKWRAKKSREYKRKGRVDRKGEQSFGPSTSLRTYSKLPPSCAFFGATGSASGGIS